MLYSFNNKMAVKLVGSFFLQKHLLSKNFLGLAVSQGSSRRGIYTLDPIDKDEPAFNKILIANRGEIACRIIDTAQRMGTKTVAIYSVADAQSKHVRKADQSVYIGGAQASESYLDIKKILQAIRNTGAEAVHPGYGFLSENAYFVKILEENGISFIGPSVNAILGMGDKLESKRLAKEAGVNTIPGFDGVVRDADHCVQIARDIGYPVMIKASAGGGGKGMRIARTDEEAREGFKLSTEEAKSSFGDSRMLVEKFIDNPRHIEIQVLADNYGNAIYLNERECSIQRRNQKVIEEAPSTFLDETTRKSMGEQAVSLCKTIGYTSAGTVEFLVDENKNFYFLEMNTRLQVEHPITECITGIDLVQQMLRIAKGHKLNITQNDVKINGWAIESRVYAEDPYKNFGLPSVGRLHKYKEPTHLPGVRCDSGVEEGSEISLYYDPMICKLVCYGKDRTEAIERSIDALDNYIIQGVTHNIPLLRDILSEKRFQEGDINTNYLPQTYKDGFKGRELMREDKHQILALGASFYATWDLKNRKYINGPRRKVHAKNLQSWDFSIRLADENFDVQVSQKNGSFIAQINGETFEIAKDELNLNSSVMSPKINKGEPTVIQLLSRNAAGDYQIVYQGTNYKMKILTKDAAQLLYIMRPKEKRDVTKQVVAPMPGVVRVVNCKNGDLVVEGQEVCIIEAMKMQNSMVSAGTGRIKSVNIKEGETVYENDVLIELEAAN